MEIRQKDPYSFIFLLVLFSLFLGGLIITSGEILIRNDAKHEEAILHDTLLSTGSVIIQAIQRNVSTGIYATETLLTLLQSNNYIVDDFNQWGAKILASNQIVSAVQLAPEGIVSYCYPLEGNEGAIGHDLLKDQRRDDGALKAINSKQLTFIGPVKLVQNNKFAVIARKPVFITIDGQEQFWGFTIAIILIENIIPEEIDQLKKEGIFFSLRGDDPDSKVDPEFFTSSDSLIEDELVMKISVPNGMWQLAMNHTPIYNRYYHLIRVILILFSIFFSGYIFIQQFRMRKKTLKIIELNKKLKELSLIDELTGLRNRRSGMHILENLIHQSKRYKDPLTIGLIDLDFFKNVNDQYGHPAGDKVLGHCGEIMNKTIRKSDNVFRLGGDEFLTIFPRTDISKALTIATKIARQLKEFPCIWETNSIPVTLSFGLAEYSDNEKIKHFISRADKQLYRAKESGRDRICYKGMET